MLTSRICARAGWSFVTRRIILNHMPRFVAFLRAINVGGRNVKMDQLRRIFESAGFSNVETFIASGKVIFESSSKNQKTLEKKLERELERSLGYPVLVFVRSFEHLAVIVSYQPFKKMPERGALYIAFLPEPVDAANVEKLLGFPTKTDKFHFHEREMYWLCLTSFSDSALSGPRLEKLLEKRLTVRNSMTIRRIAAKYESV